MKKKLKKNISREGKIYAIIYCRVSSEKQKNEGHGLDSQETRCRQYAKQKGYEVVEVFRDSFTGGGDFMRRPAMRGLLSYVEKNAYKNYVVIFDDLKRFARDVAKHWELRHLFISLGVELESPNFEFKKDSEEGWLNETVSAVFNEYDRRTNKRQVVQKMKARLESGYWAFGVKRGYTLNKDPFHGKLSIPHKKDAVSLKKALEGFSTGLFVRKIDACEYLLEQGFWKGNQAKKYVYRFDQLLRDSFYAGYIEYEQWEVFRRTGHHEKIISLETFNLNQKRLSGNTLTKRIRNDVSEDFPLRGLHNCSECEKHITGGWTTKPNGKKFGYYFCQNLSCKEYRKSINKKVIEKEFNELLIKNGIKPETENLLNLMFNRVWDEEMKNLKSLNNKIVSEKKDLERKIEKITEMIISTKSEDVRYAYEKQIEKIILEIKEIEDISIKNIDLKCGPYRTRTCHPIIANDVLYQMS
jgi:site-specific DNA recombinase